MYVRKGLTIILRYDILRFSNLCYKHLRKQLQTMENLTNVPLTAAFWCICSRRLLKSLWQKKKLLIMINFSFCHNVFNSKFTFINRDNVFNLNAFKFVCRSFIESKNHFDIDLTTLQGKVNYSTFSTMFSKLFAKS